MTRLSCRGLVKSRRSLEKLRRCASTEASSSGSGLALTDVVQIYKARVARGALDPDENQLRAVLQLAKTQQQLIDYEPPPTTRALLHTLTTPLHAQSSSDANSLASRLLGHAHQPERSLVRVLTEEQALLELDTPQGFMLVGPPGTGKSVLLDLFFDALPTSRKIRRHYEQMLLHLYHQSFHYLESTRLSAEASSANTSSPWSRREELKARALTEGWRSVFAGGRSLSDPNLQREYVLAQLAAQLIQNEGWLLAFDEFQMVDVAGASLLRSVLEWYFRLGGVVIGTSNRLPDDLYQHGVARQQFLSFINLLQKRCPIVELDTPVDYRRTFVERAAREQEVEVEPERFQARWFQQADRSRYDELAKSVIGTDGQAESMTLPVYGRKVTVPQTYHGRIARMSFNQLCRAELGPADYLTITSRFDTLILDDIPVLLVAQKNEARRFISVIDALYETKTKLICVAADAIDAIFFPDAGEVDEKRAEGDSLTEEAISELFNEPYRPNISTYEEPETPTSVQSQSQPESAPVMPAERRTAQSADERHPSSLSSIPAFRSLAIFSGQDERFAFRRAVSRLHEITSPWYHARVAHAPVPEPLRSWEKKFEPRREMRPRSLDSVAADPKTLNAETTPVKVALTPDKIRVKYAEGSPAFVHARKQQQQEEEDNEDVPKPREKPPSISPVHIWGVLESWGRRAGRWGRGASAYEQQDKDR